MNIIIKATNIPLTDALRAHVHKRITPAEKFITSPETAIHVEIGRTSNHHKSGDVYRAEVYTMHGKQKFYAVATHKDMYAAIDELEHMFIRELTDNRSRVRKLWKRGAQKVKAMMKGVTDFPKRFRK
jgi:ribosomal subunit interface protein